MKLSRYRRRLGTVLLATGVLFLAYGAAVYFWHDPATDLYARWKQHGLDGELEESFAEYRAPTGVTAAAAEPAAAGENAGTPSDPAAGDASAADGFAIRSAARRYFERLELGQPLGRIVIPKLGIDPVFVNGTRWGADLSRGPGRFPETELPGMGTVTAIAGHRTTFGAPFRHIDDLEPGDEITLELAYGTFRYSVTGHEIVDDEDWTEIRSLGFDTLVLSACHPLYSASQRWIVQARLTEVELPDGETYRPAPAASAEASG